MLPGAIFKAPGYFLLGRDVYILRFLQIWRKSHDYNVDRKES